jgi:Uri superfamily endonuclease
MMPVPASRRSCRLTIPAVPGTYALWMPSVGGADIQIGRLGRLRTRPGAYVYVGSAGGPGGLRARLSHHCRGAPHPRWHLDYLRTVLLPQAAWYTPDPLPREHAWARLFAAAPGASIPLMRFGASDCRCAAHLFFFEHRPGLRDFRQRASRCISGHGPITAARFGWFEGS